MWWLFGMYAGVLGAILYFNYLSSERRMNKGVFERRIKEQERQMDRYRLFIKLADDADDLKEYEIGDVWQEKATEALEEIERINQILLDL